MRLDLLSPFLSKTFSVIHTFQESVKLQHKAFAHRFFPGLLYRCKQRLDLLKLLEKRLRRTTCINTTESPLASGGVGEWVVGEWVGE